MAEQADTDDDVTRKGQTLLGLKELVLEAGAAAEGYDGVFADNGVDVLGIRKFTKNSSYNNSGRWEDACRILALFPYDNKVIILFHIVYLC